MSIRLRLTLLYSSILAITLIGFSFVSYLIVERDSFNRQIDTLKSKADRIVADEAFELPDIDELAYQFAGPEIFVQTLDASGQVVDRSTSLGNNNLPIGALGERNLLNDTDWVDTALISGERRLIYSVAVADSSGETGVLQISNSLTNHDLSLNYLARILIIGNLLVILTAIGIGWRLAGVGLRPIFDLAQVILNIGRTRDFAQRVNYHGSSDEIGQLANTFDLMLSELEDAYRQTEQALKTQKRFVADASHELRTPLTTVRGNLALLQRDPPINESDRQDVLNDLTEETDRLIRLVNNLLVLARADVQPSQWQDPILLQPVLETVERQITQLAPDRQVCFESNSNGHGDPVILQGNQDALKQVLLILLDNAIKHTLSTAQIYVQSSICQSHVEICVRDTGPGIPQDHLERIFERFYLVDDARTHNSTGLGLAIARTLLESQNGKIHVESAINEGTTFKIILPYQPQQS